MANSFSIRGSYSSNIGAGLDKDKAAFSGLSSASASGLKGGASALDSFGSKIEGMGSKLSGYASHAKSQITGLIGSLGSIAGIGGIFSIGAGLEQGISQAESQATALESLKAASSDSTEQMSELLAVGQKYGISAAAITGLVEKEDKAVGKLSMTTASTSTVQNKAALQSLEVQKAALMEAGGLDKVTKASKSVALQGLEAQKAELQQARASDTRTKASRSEYDASVKNVDGLIREQRARDKLTGSTGGGAAAQLAYVNNEIKIIQAHQAAVLPANKLIELQQEYGVALTDSSGKALGYTALLENIAQATKDATTAQQKAQIAALASQVLGKGYATLLPILEQGKQGYIDNAAQAKAYGDTVGDSNVKDLADFKAASENAQLAVKGVEMQLGLLVIPDITGGLNDFTTFVETHQADIKNFFQQGLDLANQIGAVVTGTVLPAIEKIAGAAKSLWDTIPGPMKELLIGGVVANKASSWLFGGSPLGAVTKGAASLGGDVLSKLVGGFFQKGTLGNPMITKDIGGLPGVGGGAASTAEDAAGAGGAAEAAGGIGAATIIGGVAITAIAAAAVAWVANDQRNKIQAQGAGVVASAAGMTAGGATTAQLQTALAGAEAGQQRLNSNIFMQGMGMFTGANEDLDKTIASLKTQIAASQAKTEQERHDSPIVDALKSMAADGGPLDAGAVVPEVQALASVFKDSTAASGTSVKAAIKLLGELETKALHDHETALAKEIESEKDALSKLLVQENGLLVSLPGAITGSMANWTGGFTQDVANAAAAAARKEEQNLTPPPTATDLGYGGPHQMGMVGITSGSTHLGWAGEAGHEAVAIIRNPRPLSAATGGGQPGELHVHVHVDGGVLSPGAVRELGQSLGPAITMWMQRNRILPRMGTAQRG